jgi:LAS superfamily LD-carboxypeptidase LdcB
MFLSFEIMKNSILYPTLLVFTLGFWFSFIPTQKYSLDELMGIKEPKMKGDNFNLRPEVADAFVLMQSAAKKERIDLYSLSSYRSYSHQLRIYNKKWKRYKSQGLEGLDIINKIIEYSTIPGTSRHHYGTDLDVIDASISVTGDKLLPGNYEKGGVYEKLGEWITNHSEEYGFYVVYTNKPTRKGFKHEPWHLSYKETSQPMLRQYLSEDWSTQLKTINGYEFMNAKFLEKYSQENIQDINPDLL